MKYLTIIAIW